MSEENYDIIQYLEDNDIPYTTSGKNVTRNWVNISCPFCGDRSNHLGISLEFLGFNCWVCGEKGNIYKLVMHLEGISYYQARTLLEKYPAGILFPYQQDTKIVDPTRHISLEGFDIIAPDLHADYLKTRGFDPEEIQRKYQIRFCYQIGRFPYRIIIPVILDGKVVNLTARDVTGEQAPKYKNLSNDEAIRPMKDCLYNFDSVSDRIIIVEGVTDVWRIGQGSVATMGTEYTLKQIALIMKKDIKKAFILYDADATRKAEKLANELSILIPTVEVITLDSGDPADMKPEEVKQLRKELNL